MNNLEIIDYKSFNIKNINIKDLLLKKLSIEEIKIETLEDIARLSELFSKVIPFSNFELINGNYTFNIDSLVDTIDSKGGRCLHLNFIFGLLLTEFNIEVKLVKALEDSPNKLYKIFDYHYGNYFRWNQDNKLYFHDIGLGFLNHYYPIEIGNKEPIFGYSNLLPKSLYRVIKNENIQNDLNYNGNNNNINNRYILERKLIGEDDQFKPIFEFKINDIITLDVIYERSIRFNKSQYCFPVSSILSNDGYHLFANNSLTIISPRNNRSYKKIENKTQLESILLNSFNLNINNFKYFLSFNIQNNNYLSKKNILD